MITAGRMTAAYFDAFGAVCRVTPAGWYAERGTARAMVTGADVPLLNLAHDTALEPDLGCLEAMATEVGRRAAHWSVIVRSEAGDAVTDLAAGHGLVRRGGLPLLACAAGDVVFRAGATPGTRVRRADAAESDRYTEILAQGFETPAGVFGSLMGGRVLDADPMTGYLAETSGQPTGTGFGVLGPGVLGVFNIAVVPSARGRGLGRAITETVLRDGFAAGAEAAYLLPSAVGRGLYESMGFRLAANLTMFTAG
ncbi:GNAT family N-acetyltransferase [Plantactinospora sp. KBS50]|uniref:GNAT family N-acetyltransferase n=1 Tax=Plantactinospora sp. KBS50 TaxID=2024580 RepID=UPI000BAAEEFF|nr:GNAT family N-acetyltransferase [Plantactinospora sp. KBS50]ASW55662.1 hypothetical protein CIK06_17940 [Plantactinospora sp. KBS50]